MYRIQTRYLNDKGTGRGPWESSFIDTDFKTEKEAVHTAKNLFHKQFLYTQAASEGLDSTPRPYRVVKVVWQSTGLPKGENYDKTRKEAESSKKPSRKGSMGKGKARRKA